MSGSCSANTFSWTMATAPSERTRISRRAGHLVLGIDDRIASTVFGTITAMATVTVYGKAFPDSPWKVEELVASTAIVLWIAHLYTHALSESISEDRRLDGARVSEDRGGKFRPADRRRVRGHHPGDQWRSRVAESCQQSIQDRH